MIAIGVVSAVVLSKNADAGSHPLEVKVFAQQFAWKFEYPGNVKSDELVMPLDRAVQFDMQSADVIHSLWIPQMGQKQDVVPGIETEIVITPTRTGSFTLDLHRALRPRPRDHARPGARARAGCVRGLAREAEGRERRRRAHRAAPGRPAGAAAHRRARSARRRSPPPAAAAATRSTPAGTDAQVGPDLDNVAADAQKAGEPVADYVRQSIVDPNAVVAAGYQPGVMPPNFGDTLSPEELDALVAYLSGKEAK